MNITDFLLARITEDEVRATMRNWHAEDCGWIPDESGYSYPCNCGVPERMTAECAAKRAIVELHDALEDKGWQSGKDHGYLWCGSCGSMDDAPVPYPCETLEALAAVYKDHPDYQQEWANG